MSDDESEDPFESMEDREGDPFEQLGGPDDTEAPPAGDEMSPSDVVDASPAEDAASPSEASEDSDPAFEEEFIEKDAVSVSGEGVPDAAGGPESFDSDPFGEMETPEDDPFQNMGGGDGDPFGSAESAFEAVDVEELDDEELWEAIDSEDETPIADERRYSEVSKHRFCEQCEFFAEPPASHCNHDEASIMEFLDMDKVRVVNCPIVAEQRRIENEE